MRSPRRGFTLAEVLIVITLMAVLMPLIVHTMSHAIRTRDVAVRHAEMMEAQRQMLSIVGSDVRQAVEVRLGAPAWVPTEVDAAEVPPPLTAAEVGPATRLTVPTDTAVTIRFADGSVIVYAWVWLPVGSGHHAVAKLRRYKRAGPDEPFTRQSVGPPFRRARFTRPDTGPVRMEFWLGDRNWKLGPQSYQAVVARPRTEGEGGP